MDGHGISPSGYMGCFLLNILLVATDPIDHFGPSKPITTTTSALAQVANNPTTSLDVWTAQQHVIYQYLSDQPTKLPQAFSTMSLQDPRNMD